jgi:hypothetical protein
LITTKVDPHTATTNSISTYARTLISWHYFSPVKSDFGEARANDTERIIGV